MVDRDGLLVDGMVDIAAFQKPFVQKESVCRCVENWITPEKNKLKK